MAAIDVAIEGLLPYFKDWSTRYGHPSLGETLTHGPPDDGAARVTPHDAATAPKPPCFGALNGGGGQPPSVANGTTFQTDASAERF